MSKRCDGTKQVGEEIVYQGRSMGFKECPGCPDCKPEPNPAALVNHIHGMNKPDAGEYNTKKIRERWEALAPHNDTTLDYALSELFRALDYITDLQKQLAERDNKIKRLKEALEAFVDDDPCSFDHHGYCQAHGGDKCRNENAKQTLQGKEKVKDDHDTEVKE